MGSVPSFEAYWAQKDHSENFKTVSEPQLTPFLAGCYVLVYYLLRLGQYRPIHTRTAQLWGSVLSTVLPQPQSITQVLHVTARLAHAHKVGIKTERSHVTYTFTYMIAFRGRIMLAHWEGNQNYGKIRTAIDDQGLVSGMTTVTWHVTWWHTHSQYYYDI